jgi:hypothetical protein
MEETKQRGKFTVDLKDKKRPWIDWCEERGLVPGDVLKRAVAEMMGEAERQPSIQLDREKIGSLNVGAKDSERERIEIRLLRSEYEKIISCVEADGFGNAQQWLVALVRNYLTRTPQFGQREFELLGESNRQLLALGRNLNQIAKAVHQHGLEGGEFTVERIVQLRVVISKHTEAVSQLVANNVERWSVV